MSIICGIKGLYQKNHDIKLIDCFNNKLEKSAAIHEILTYSPDVIGISLSMSPTVTFGIEILNEVKKRSPNIVTVAGGVHATFDYPSLIRETCIDYIILHEGEVTFAKLIEYIDNRKNINNDIPGVVYKKDGKVIKTDGLNIIENLDSLQFPSRNLLANQNNYKRRQVLSSRGCVYRCIYCAATAMNNYTWRKRSAENVFEEINLINNLYGNRFYFADDNFTVDNYRVLELCRLLKESKLKTISILRIIR